MTEDDRPRFAALVAAVAETFNETVSTARAEGYWLGLSDLPIEAVQAACATAIRESKFFPRPAELRSLAGYGVPDAGMVEGLLYQHMRQPGGERTMPSDPFLRLCVERLGGMYRLSDMSSETRLRALAKLVPGVVAAAQARGLALPCEARDGRPALPPPTVPLVEHRAPELPRRGGDMARVGDVLAEQL